MKDYLATFVNTNGVAFPGTAGKNATSPGATDGTEWIKAFIDDAWGARQAVMSSAGIIPDGVSEAVGTSQFLEAMILILAQQHQISGLLMSNNGADALNDIDLSIGKAFDSTGTVFMNLATVLTKQIDAAWVEGDASGGMFLGSVAINTRYAYFLIRKDSDGTIDAGFDISPIGANVPAGWSSYRRVGWADTDGSGNILPFNEQELAGGQTRRVYDAAVADVSGGASAPTTRTPVTLSVPPDTIAQVSIELGFAGASFGLFQETTTTDVAPSGTSFTLVTATGATSSSVSKEILVDASSQIAVRGSTGSGTYNIITNGHVDRRVS